MALHEKIKVLQPTPTFHKTYNANCLHSVNKISNITTMF